MAIDLNGTPCHQCAIHGASNLYQAENDGLDLVCGRCGNTLHIRCADELDKAGQRVWEVEERLGHGVVCITDQDIFMALYPLEGDVLARAAWIAEIEARAAEEPSTVCLEECYITYTRGTKVFMLLGQEPVSWDSPLADAGPLGSTNSENSRRNPLL